MTDRYINRELSWLEFNARVLDEALDPQTPLLERLRFLSIFTSNLDEFFMVRIAGLMKMEQEGIVESDSPEAVNSTLILKKLKSRIIELIDKQYDCFHEEILTKLRKFGVQIRAVDQLTKEQKLFTDRYFKESIFPVLTPLSFDAAHPFPFLSNLSLYLVVTPEETKDQNGQELPKVCFVEIPSILPRLIKVPSKENEYHYVQLEDLISANLDELFIGINFKYVSVIRVTRNLDYDLLENEVTDLLKTIKKEMILREQQAVVRLQITDSLPDSVVRIIKKYLGITDDQIYFMQRPIYICPYTELCKLPFKDLKFPYFNPRLPQRLAGTDDIFSIISKEELLAHHPYESFYTFTEFLTTAALDPDVLAIKQTLYRTAGDSPIIQSLIEAAREGKQVTAVIELKARFDEKNNIVWARELERAGVNVVFGFVGLKTHGKATLVVRKENNKLKRYVHLSTGNYNPNTAKLYTDLSFFTCDDDIADDVQVLFNLVTGANMLTLAGTREKTPKFPRLKKIAISPLNLRQRTLELIDREITLSKTGTKGKIIAKMNALVDRAIIDKLYEASQAGVKIQLIVRGICCLRPGVKKLSENIEVISIIDRFLEHSRIFYYQAGGKDEVYLSSADWMPRNMDRRIECLFPVENPKLKERIINEILDVSWRDNVKAREILPDGGYKIRPTPRELAEQIRSQTRFIELAREEGLKSLPYDKALKHIPLHEKGQRPVQDKLKKKKKRKEL